MGLRMSIKNKISQFSRVISVSRKPDKEEFLSTVKICGVGILLIGFVGFVIYVLFRLV